MRGRIAVRIRDALSWLPRPFWPGDEVLPRGEGEQPIVLQRRLLGMPEDDETAWGRAPAGPVVIEGDGTVERLGPSRAADTGATVIGWDPDTSSWVKLGPEEER